MKFLATILLCLTFFTTSAQDWLTEYEKSTDLYFDYQLSEAKARAETALSLFTAEVTEPHKNTATILRQLSLICYELGEIENAIDFGNREIETLTSLGLDGDISFADALYNLGAIFIGNAQYVDAEVVINSGLAITANYFDAQSPEVAVAKGNYAAVLFNLKRDEEAGILFSESIPVIQQMEELPTEYNTVIYDYSSYKANNGDFQTALNGYLELEDWFAYDAPNYDYGAILNKVGDALDQLGRFTEAIQKYQKAIDNFEQIGEQESEEYAIAQNLLANDLQKTGQFTAAMETLESVLATRRQSIDTSPEAFALTAVNYGTLLKVNGQTTKSSEILQEVVDLYSSKNLREDLTLINALSTKSEIDLSLGNFDLAGSEIDKALAINEVEKIAAKDYALFNQKAKVLARAGKYAEAKTFADNALDAVIASFGGNSIQSAFVRNSLAGIYSELGKYDIAQKQYLASLPIIESTYGHQHPEYATAAANYSSLLQLTGNYFAAELYLEDAVEIKRATFGADNLDYLTTYENLALLYLATARYTDALRVLDEIKLQKESVLADKDASLAYTYSNLANAKKLVAEYPESESYFRKAREIYEATLGKDHILYASTINNLALLYQKMGNLEAAKPLFQEALQVYESQIGKLSPDYATALENLATLYQMEKNSEKAKELLEEALEIDEKILGKEHPLYSKTLHNLASIYEADEDYEKARDLFLTSLEIDKKVFSENHPSYASTLYNLAVLEQSLENYEIARNHYEKVAQIRLTVLGENHPDYAFSVYGLASIAQKTGDFELAKTNYEIVITKYLEDIREYFPALSESEKSAFYGKIRPVFEAFMDFAIEYIVLNQGSIEDRDGMLKQLYDLQLSTKALLLNASNKVRNRILNSVDQELIALFQDWIGLKENIVKSLALSKEEIEQNNIDIGAMQTEANDLEKELSLKSTAFEQEFEKDVITWEDVKAKLTDRDAALEIIRIKKNLKNDSILYATLIVESFSEAPRLVLLSNGDVLEDRAFKIYKNSIVYKIDDKKSFDVFWKDINAEITKVINNIYLSADGVFNKVNIATLFDPEEDEYVVDKYNIRLLSNTKELVEGGNESNPENFAQIFGYPKYNLDKAEMDALAATVDEAGMRYSFGDNVAELPGTLEEINNISGILTDKSWDFKKYIEAEASENNIKQMTSPKIFHIATHGFFLEDIPVTEDDNEGLASRSQKYNPLMRSGLLFAGAENTIRKEDLPGEEDGILTAYEAMNLNLDNTDLVVMSACETGLGEVKNGEGVYGLQRAFIVAGAQNLIMSLWKVNDATTQLLMSTFYNEWFSGHTRTEAFNSAIATVKKDYPHPYFWGAFVMLGK